MIRSNLEESDEANGWDEEKELADLDKWLNNLPISDKNRAAVKQEADCLEDLATASFENIHELVKNWNSKAIIAFTRAQHDLTQAELKNKLNSYKTVIADQMSELISAKKEIAEAKKKEKELEDNFIRLHNELQHDIHALRIQLKYFQDQVGELVVKNNQTQGMHLSSKKRLRESSVDDDETHPFHKGEKKGKEGRSKQSRHTLSHPCDAVSPAAIDLTQDSDTD
uniref:Uncharacterized protein n=1 Tax=Aureoumbra lagunensis TaxID=44058 RepID=A0A7S3K2K1_9STRA|mmetsp:Transcript_22038/g.26520  ORF Transcript_22038/g.26520 Transcript_22038/m.26520 type:complete len:225 (-) Transcript_22038:458-1132(-)|eukprot:CAMPEP_0197288252 /NCGR_PEP_ID=MMETSP0890-20130614/5266_1 /TAXON_ID=44058 ORGANISM="Aureoumbra lagunensis, Strain CCMP1510" /NCGR_SAMPLE_ID=MMETSP0890 /ASSEMBLY_ACC=CAM_ASM_000533 /LENGTH=224 /DNA_ID=CAMNT_0042758823 /DNA_START=167 /DNA_END=841 /DNA_ORIENTATION=+